MDVRIAGDRIVELAASTSPPRPDGVTVLDGRGLLAIPGLVNAHTHSPENCLRGVGEGLPLEPWLCLMFAAAGSYSPEDHYACALAGAVEMLRTGTTACVDHLWMTPPTVEAADAALRAYQRAGIRAAVAPLMSDLDSTDQLAQVFNVDISEVSLVSQGKTLPAGELLAQFETIVNQWHGAEGGRLRVLAGPSGVQWCSDELLTGLAQVARQRGSGIHLHLLETFVQDAACRLRFGTSAVVGLDRLTVLGPDCSLAHSVWIDDADISLIAENGVIVVHNPAANLRLGSGRAPVRQLLDREVEVALGTDGSASSDNQIVWDAIKLAALVHHDEESAGVSGSQALRMATRSGAAVLGEPTLGTLEAGSLADIALLDMSAESLAGAYDLEGSLALSEDGRAVRHVIVNGHVVVTDGHCLTVDEQETRALLKEQAAKRLPHDRYPARGTQIALRQAAQLRGAVGDHVRSRPL